MARMSDEDLAGGDPAMLAEVYQAERETQLVDALEDLALPADAYLRWPWEELDALYGGMAPGTVHYVVGYSGNGKTTFIASAIRLWAQQGVVIDVLPLELRPKVFQTYMACVELGIDPGDVTSGDAKKWSNWPEMRRLIAAELARQSLVENVRVKGTETVDVAALDETVQRAWQRQARVVIVDHVDHIKAGGPGASGFQVSEAVQLRAHELAKEYELVILLMSQANNDAIKGAKDKLARYAVLSEASVWMGQTKRQVATGMLSLFRPLQLVAPGEDPKEHAKKLKRAKTGEDAPQTALIPGRIGVNLMKSRTHGDRDGRSVHLGYRSGRIESLTNAELMQAEAERHGIRTHTSRL